MRVNEEIDALQTIGLDPVEVLVIPRLSRRSRLSLFFAVLPSNYQRTAASKPQKSSSSGAIVPEKTAAPCALFRCFGCFCAPGLEPLCIHVVTIPQPGQNSKTNYIANALLIAQTNHLVPRAGRGRKLRWRGFRVRGRTLPQLG
jgi:hypothetical protein